MKRSILLVIGVLFCTMTAMAQSYCDVVYLHNGSVIRGQVVEHTIGGKLRVQTADGSLFVYESDEVRLIEKELVKNSRRPQYNYELNKSVYRGYVELSGTMPTGKYWEPHIDFATGHGAYIHPYIYAGGGIGFSVFPDEEFALIPIYGEVRGILPTNVGVKPYIGMRLGVSTDFGSVGLYVSPAIGFSVRRFDLSLAYTGQFLYSENIGGGLTLRLGIRLGK